MLNEFQRKLFDTIGGDSYVETFAAPGREVLLIEPYTYGISASGLTLSAPQDFTITMDSDSEFVAVFASGAATYPGGAQNLVRSNAGVLIQVRENWSGKTWFNIPTLMPLVAGESGYPFIMPSPRKIPPRTTLTVTAGPSHARTTIDSYAGQFSFHLHGGRIYYR